MLKVHLKSVRDYCHPAVRCEARRIKPSKDYRLLLSVATPCTITGCQSSYYAKSVKGEVKWTEPFGKDFTVDMGGRDQMTLIICLLRRHVIRLVPDEKVATFTLELPLASHEPDIILESDTHQVRVLINVTIQSHTVDTVKQEVPQLANTTPTERTTNTFVEVKSISGIPGVEALGDAPPSCSTPMESTPSPSIKPVQSETHSPEATTFMKNRVGWKELLEYLDVLVGLVDTAAELHPMAKLAWGVVSAAYKMVSDQVDRDEKVEGLIEAMAKSCSFVQQVDFIKERSSRFVTVTKKILQQVVQCTYFVKEYYKNKSFGARAFKSIVTGVDQQISSYTDALKALLEELDNTANLNTAVIVYRVLDDLNEMSQQFDKIEARDILSDLKYAEDARLNIKKGCLPGTRTETINGIMFWASQADRDLTDISEWGFPSYRAESRVLWICGLSGSGKTSIARSVADRLQEMERLGSYFSFSKTTTLSSLFSTVARDLADKDPLRKRHLVDAIRDKTAIRKSPNVSEQFEEFILAPAIGLPTVGDTVIIIDGFDESADKHRDRSDLLRILTEHAHKIPEGLKFIITSRFESDVQDALGEDARSHAVDLFLLDHIPESTTSQDIVKFIHHSFENVKQLRRCNAELDRLTVMAEQSFQWASTTCRFVLAVDDGGGGTYKDRLTTILEGGSGLDQLYTTILDRWFLTANPRILQILRSITSLMICAVEPLSLRSLIILSLSYNEPTEDDVDEYQQVASYLGSVISGVHDLNTAIKPLHTSFSDYLCDTGRSGKYSIHLIETKHRISRRCLEIMVQGGLRFNITNFPSSSLLNKKIPEDQMRIMRQAISPVLSYSCQYWCHHITEPDCVSERNALGSLLLEFFQIHFLHWLEVMSVLEYAPLAVLVSISDQFVSLHEQEIRLLAEDAIHFTTTFLIPIMASVPHIYLSCLPFVPGTSRIQSMLFNYPNLARVKTGQKATWNKHVTVFEGHSSIVRCVAFAPIGPFIASASDDHTVRVWNYSTGTSVELKKHTNRVNCLAFSPDAMQLVSGSYDCTLIIWDLKTNTAMRDPLVGHCELIWTVAFAPSGDHFASGSDDGIIHLWDASRGEKIGDAINGHQGCTASVAFSSDSCYIVSSGFDDCTVRVWDVKTQLLLRTIITEDHYPTCALFSSNGIFVGTEEGGILRIGADDVTSLFARPNSHVNSISLSPDQMELVSGHDDRSIRFWDTRTGLETGRREGHTDYISSVAYSLNGKYVASGSQDRTVRIWGCQSDAPTDQPPEQNFDWVRTVAYSPNGKYIATGSDDRSVRVWNADNGKLIGKLDGVHTDYVLSLAYNPRGDRLVTSSRDLTIQLWDVETMKPVGPPWQGHRNNINSVAFSPNKSILISGSDDCSIGIWDMNVSPPSPRFLRQHTKAVSSVAFSPTGTTFASASYDTTIIIWDTETTQQIGEPLQGSGGYLFSIAYSPDGTNLVVGSQSQVVVWDVTSRAVMTKPMRNHIGCFRSVGFSPCGNYVISGSDDRLVRIWDWKRSTMLGKPAQGLTNIVMSVAFSPNGKQIASGSSDNTVRVWDIFPNSDSAVLSETVLLFNPNQYPPAIFPNQEFNIKDGWILGPIGELVLWIPHEHRAGLCGPSHSRVLNNLPITELDFGQFKYGTEWAQCYKNRSL